MQLVDLLRTNQHGAELAFSVAAPLGTEPPDLVALLVGGSGKVRSDDDLIFYNNRVSVDRSVQYLGPEGSSDRVGIRLAEADPDVTRIVLGCAGGPLDSPGTESLEFSIQDQAAGKIAVGLVALEPNYRAVILAEIYRRNEQWRIRFVAQGYHRGLEALVTEFGVEVDATPTELPDTSTKTTFGTGQDRQPSPTRNQYSPPPSQPAPAQFASRPHPTPDDSQSPATEPMPQMESGVSPSSDVRTDNDMGSRSPQFVGPERAWQEPQVERRRGGFFTSKRRAQLEAQNAHLTQILSQTGAMDNVAIAQQHARLAEDLANITTLSDQRRVDLARLEQRLAEVHAQIGLAEGDVELAEIGIYRYRHRLDDSIAYKASIDKLRDQIKTSAKSGRAVTGSTSWTVDGSAAKGRKMVNEVSKLMLRAYNADADHAVRTMRPYKLDSALSRLDTTRSTIARLGATMRISVTEGFHRLRRQELELTADYLNKMEEEKERQRQLREEQREQQRAEAEYVRENERLVRERSRYADALEQLESRGETKKADEIRARLAAVADALAGIAKRQANLRLGHVYVISNIGAFGQRMVKIGMTRRLDPNDRVRELGDASVPFRFDTHAIIFSEDAVGLETALHQRFAKQRVNRVNLHREFFYVTPAEVRDALRDMGNQYMLQFNEQIDAPEPGSTAGHGC